MEENKINKHYQRSFNPLFKKPTLTEIIFEIIEKTLNSPIFDVFLSNYSESYRKARFYALNPNASKWKSKEEWKEDLFRRLRHNFYTRLSVLQKKGFIEKQKEGKLKNWHLTLKGKEEFEKLKSKIGIILRKKYLIKKDDKLKIIIFDIPEKEKTKREWLRLNLISLGFTMLQKSVWMGKNKLPQEFFEDLGAIDILPYIYIFHISKEDSETLKIN